MKKYIILLSFIFTCSSSFSQFLFCEELTDQKLGLYLAVKKVGNGVFKFKNLTKGVSITFEFDSHKITLPPYAESSIFSFSGEAPPTSLEDCDVKIGDVHISKYYEASSFNDLYQSEAEIITSKLIYNKSTLELQTDLERAKELKNRSLEYKSTFPQWWNNNIYMLDHKIRQTEEWIKSHSEWLSLNAIDVYQQVEKKNTTKLIGSSIPYNQPRLASSASNNSSQLDNNGNFLNQAGITPKKKNEGSYIDERGSLVLNNPTLSDNKLQIMPSKSVDADENRIWSQWLFVQSDKALQYRFSRVSGTGEGIYQIKIQYRINKTDDIYCSDANCNGYIYWGGFYSLDGRGYSKEYRLYFSNNFKGNTSGMQGVYTLPETIPIEVKTFSDGKRIWDEDEQRCYFILDNGYKDVFRFADACVDEKLSDTDSNRCGFYNQGPITTIE